VTRAVEFITTIDASPSVNELQLTKRLFSILLHGLCNPLEKKNHWNSAWSVRPALRKYTARIMIWLLEPHQSINTRVYAIRSLMEEPRAREILSCILEVHPQVSVLISSSDVLHTHQDAKFIIICNMFRWSKSSLYSSGTCCKNETRCRAPMPEYVWN